VSGLPGRMVLLGPQRPTPDVGRVVRDLVGPGPTALITAGWQEWEEDDAWLRAEVGPGAFNLTLYARAHRVAEEDPELVAGHRELQRKVRELRHTYNVRLAPAMKAWIDLSTMSGTPEVVGPERDDALEAVRALDRHHADRLEELRAAYYHRFDPHNRPSIARQRDELRRALGPAAAVVIEGGHVPVLVNRLRMFGVGELIAGKVVVACSGGAMALSPRIVLFHDSPPWGPGHAEVGDVGLSLYSGLLVFPNGSRRLRLDDPGRVARLARRFAPDPCVVLDSGTRLDFDGSWHSPGSLLLTDTGGTAHWRGAA
jgi:hypothetical protein